MTTAAPHSYTADQALVSSAAFCVFLRSTAAGTYRASVKVHTTVALTKHAFHVAGSPFQFDVEPGPISALQSTLSGFEPRVATGSTITLTVQARDQYGNNLKMGGDSLYARWLGPTLIAGDVTDNRDGTYTIQVKLNEPGQYLVDVMLYRVGTAMQALWSMETVRGQHIANSPFLQSVSGYARRGDYEHKSVSCSDILATDAKLTNGRWVAFDVLRKRSRLVDQNATRLGAYRWVFSECVPRVITPLACTKCLKNRWVHIVGDGTSRDMYRLIQALLVQHTMDEEGAQQPGLHDIHRRMASWWSQQIAGTVSPHLNVLESVTTSLGFGSDPLRLTTENHIVYRFTTKTNTTLTWAPLLDTPNHFDDRTDRLSQLVDQLRERGASLPEFIVVSLSLAQLCDLTEKAFRNFFEKFAGATLKLPTRIIWLLPPAIHDVVYHERFRSCSYEKIKARTDFMRTSLHEGHDVVDFFAMTKARVDATSDGARYVWALAPEPINENPCAEAPFF
eukprot:c19300_g1_i2.p1 GENE.c19300_g1_i2~~c19300_g1_i2.p1  ORF type:complete len:522 (-),score=95.30 c19300_g1_i2:380-1897(-)